jgi:hypothetical protein
LRYTKEELFQALDAGVRLPLVRQYGSGGMKHPAYAETYKQAWAYAGLRMDVKRFLK